MSKIVWIIVVIIALGVGCYFIFSNKSADRATNSNSSPQIPSDQSTTVGDSNLGKGASYVPEEGHIQITYPVGGEQLEVGKTYDIRWANYSGNDPLTISLQSTAPNNKVSTRIIASDISPTGSYKWTITPAETNNKYKIEIYPSSGRELVGRSKDYFTISGK